MSARLFSAASTDVDLQENAICMRDLWSLDMSSDDDGEDDIM